MFSQNCMELSASSVLFFDELKIFRQIATSIIFIFIENFESSSSDLFQYKFQIFSSKRSTTNFKRIFFDLRWVQEVQSFAPLIEERPGCHHRIAGWPRILRSWEKSEVKEKCNMSKLDLKQILLTSRSDRCDLLLNGGVQIEVWSSVVNPRRMFTNAYMNQFLKQALDS